LVAKAEKVPEEGWTMQDGTPWPGNNVRDHPGMIQVLLVVTVFIRAHYRLRFSFLIHITAQLNSLFCIDRSSWVKVVAMILREMNYHDWFMFQEKNDQAIIITRKLVL
jgi:hypothetical protein